MLASLVIALTVSAPPPQRFSDAIVSTVPVPGAECYMKAPK